MSNQPSFYPINTGGYRSGVAYMGKDPMALTCSKTGCDYCAYESEGFLPMNGNYYSVSVSKDGKAAFASGPEGRVGKLVFT